MSMNEDPMTRLTSRQLAIDPLAESANGSFRLSSTKRGHRWEMDRRRRQG